MATTFLSKTGNLRLVLVPGYYEVQDVGGGHKRQIPHKGKSVQFEEIPEPGFEYRGSSINATTLWGKAVVEDPETIALLLEHPRYGVEFVALGLEGEEALPDGAFFQNLDDGQVACTLCDEVFESAQGAGGHKSSKRHQERVKELREEASNTLQ